MGRSVLDTRLLVHTEDGGEERVVLTENEGVVKVLEYVPGYLLDFVAGVGHVYAFVDRFFNFDSEHTRVAVEILSFALEAIETMCILEV